VTSTTGPTLDLSTRIFCSLAYRCVELQALALDVNEHITRLKNEVCLRLAGLIASNCAINNDDGTSR
jgi:hypothetical protein